MNSTISTNNPTSSNTTPISAASYSSFTGKERDAETGYTYHGARYFDAALLTSWMAVDPMSDKYPSLSPYNYCAWNRPTGGHEHLLINYYFVNNPVKLVDENGEEFLPYLNLNGETNTIQIRDDNNTPFDYSDDLLIGEYKLIIMSIKNQKGNGTK